MDCSPKSVTVRGWVQRRQANVKNIAMFLETLMAILHSFIRRWRSLSYDSLNLTGSFGLRDGAMMVVSSALRANSKWDVGRACHWLRDWSWQGRSVHSEPPQPACLDEKSWTSEMTLRKPDRGVMVGLYWLWKTGTLRALSCRGGHRFRRFRKLCLRLPIVICQVLFWIAPFYSGRLLLSWSAIGQLTQSVGVAFCMSLDCWGI